MDAIDRIAGVGSGSFLDTLRRRKAVTRDNAQASFEALLAPADVREISVEERAAVAYFVAGLHQDEQGLAFYREHLAQIAPAVMLMLDAEIGLAVGSGPYGCFPSGPLSAEDEAGPEFTVAEPRRAWLGPRLVAALEHVHMLVFHPRDAAPTHMQALETAGWSVTGIVTLSQLVSFLCFQLRVAAGLRALDRTQA